MNSPSKVAGTVWVIGAGLAALGSILPYGSDCETCRVLAPTGVSLPVWLPAAGAPLVVIATGVLSGIRTLLRGAPGRFAAGFLAATGTLGFAVFMAYGIHARFPGGGLFGLGGVVGMFGGLLILAGGLLALRLGRGSAPDASAATGVHT